MVQNTLNKNESKILSIIPRGSERRINAYEIQNVVDLSIRSIRKIIHDLIIKGVPIVATRQGDNKGMFIAETEAERSQGLAEFNSQINEMAQRSNAIQEADLSHWQDGFTNECKYQGNLRTELNIELLLNLKFEEW